MRRNLLPNDVVDEFIDRLERTENPFELDVSERRRAQIQSGEKDFAIDRAVNFDIDEPHAVGARDIKRQRAVQRAQDPHNREIKDPHTNRTSKGLNEDPRDIARGRERRAPISVDDDPAAIFKRRFDEVVELHQVFEEARARVSEPGRMRPTQLKNAINSNIRDIIKNGRTPAGIKVRDALRAQGFEFVEGRGLTLVGLSATKPPPRHP